MVAITTRWYAYQCEIGQIIEPMGSVSTLHPSANHSSFITINSNYNHSYSPLIGTLSTPLTHLLLLHSPFRLGR